MYICHCNNCVGGWGRWWDGDLMVKLHWCRCYDSLAFSTRCTCVFVTVIKVSGAGAGGGVVISWSSFIGGGAMTVLTFIYQIVSVLFQQQVDSYL